MFAVFTAAVPRDASPSMCSIMCRLQGWARLQHLPLVLRHQGFVRGSPVMAPIRSLGRCGYE
jgi:hypothetical protein